MIANKIYQNLEKDFIQLGMSDNWTQYMDSVADFLCDNFKARSMGLVCDFATEINHIYSAVFPSNNVMQKILDDGAYSAMLFVHHPSIWDIRKAPEVFQQMDRDLLQQFKKRQISIYNLHTPLDNFGEHSTSVSLAKALKIKVEKPFASHNGALCGIIGETNLKTVVNLRDEFKKILNHSASLYNYGNNEIKTNKVAIVAGGGNNVEILEEVLSEGINTFITGITSKNEHSKMAHDFALKNRINILGGTHYSTEKFACISMIDYFTKIGVSAKYLDDEPVIEDM